MHGQQNNITKNLLIIFHLVSCYRRKGKSEAQVYFWGLADGTVGYASLHVLSWITKTLHVCPTGRFRRSQNRHLSAFTFTWQQHKQTQKQCA